MGSFGSKKKTIVSQQLPSTTLAPIPTTPGLATNADAAQIGATDPNVTSLLGRDTEQLRKKAAAYNQYLGVNRSNVPTILGQ